jgi:hypothetical protein
VYDYELEGEFTDSTAWDQNVALALIAKATFKETGEAMMCLSSPALQSGNFFPIFGVATFSVIWYIQSDGLHGMIRCRPFVPRRKAIRFVSAVGRPHPLSAPGLLRPRVALPVLSAR